jgi:hypothetical protein
VIGCVDIVDGVTVSVDDAAGVDVSVDVDIDVDVMAKESVFSIL